MKEIQVYLIDASQDTTTEQGNPKQWSDVLFQLEAEDNGKVFSLQGFQNAVNEDDITVNHYFIRFIPSLETAIEDAFCAGMRVDEPNADNFEQYYEKK